MRRIWRSRALLRPFAESGAFSKAAEVQIWLVALSGIIHEHGGSLSIESEPDVGTTLLTRLPVAN